MEPVSFNERESIISKEYVVPALSSSRLIKRIFFIVLTILGLVISGIPQAYAMPPHPRLLDAWKAGELAVPRFMVEPETFKAKGINQPPRKAAGASTVDLQSAPQVIRA